MYECYCIHTPKYDFTLLSSQSAEKKKLYKYYMDAIVCLISVNHLFI